MIAKFIVPGEPKGKQRPRTVKNRYTGRTTTYTPEQTVIYENLVAVSYRQQCGRCMLEGPISAKITAYFQIPKSTSKKNREKMIEGTIPHTKKIDADNLAKAILDSLNQIAYHDDAQVSKLEVVKLYGEEPRVEVELAEMDFQSDGKEQGKQQAEKQEA